MATIAGGNIISNVDLTGKFVRSNSQTVVVSNTNPVTNGLAIIRGQVTWSGTAVTIDAGEGFTASSGFVNATTITFSSAFLDQPVVVGGNNGGSVGAICSSVSTSAFTLTAFNTTNGGIVTNSTLSFVVIGQRA